MSERNHLSGYDCWNLMHFIQWLITLTDKILCLIFNVDLSGFSFQRLSLFISFLARLKSHLIFPYESTSTV